MRKFNEVNQRSLVLEAPNLNPKILMKYWTTFSKGLQVQKRSR